MQRTGRVCVKFYGVGYGGIGSASKWVLGEKVEGVLNIVSLHHGTSDLLIQGPRNDLVRRSLVSGHRDILLKYLSTLVRHALEVPLQRDSFRFSCYVSESDYTARNSEEGGI